MLEALEREVDRAERYEAFLEGAVRSERAMERTGVSMPA